MFENTLPLYFYVPVRENVRAILAFRVMSSSETAFLHRIVDGESECFR